MFKKILCASVCASALMMTAANAEEKETGLYAGLDVGYSILGGEDADSSNSSLDLGIDFEDNAFIDLRVGYDYGVFRLEGEIGYHTHDAKSFSVLNNGGNAFPVGNSAATRGEADLWSFMLNGVIDFGDLADNPSVMPFAGVGIGLADLDLDNLRIGSDLVGSGSETLFAYQFFAGFRFPVTEKLDVSLKYRYLATEDATITDSLAQRFDVSYDVHDIVIGFTLKFGGKEKSYASEQPKPIPVAVVEPEPEPAPVIEEPVAPEPMPEPAAGPEINKGPYVVYFDWDRSDLDGGDIEIISEAATAARQSGENVMLKVDGHADRSGSDGYNQKLSETRAAAVKLQLVEEGLSEDQIDVTSHGESDTAVATEDNVKEAGNRRVTIVIE